MKASTSAIAPDPEERARRRRPASRARRSWLATALRGARIVMLAWLVVTVTVVVLLRWLPPPGSAFMARAAVLAYLAGRDGIDYRWVPATRIADSARIAIVAAEDQRFPVHSGFDFAAIRAALERNRSSAQLRGASTLSQQVAKNLFLWPDRSWLRKLLEAYFTVLIELFWSKGRILEVYLNIAEFGDGVFGVEAAARRFFARPAADLTAGQSALLAAVLPNPRRYRADRPTSYVLRRQAWVRRQMYQLGGNDYLRAIESSR